MTSLENNHETRKPTPFKKQKTMKNKTESTPIEFTETIKDTLIDFNIVQETLITEIWTPEEILKLRQSVNFSFIRGNLRITLNSTDTINNTTDSKTLLDTQINLK